MLDFDLAGIYGYETKNFNKQVKNNIEKFDNDFMFKLTKDEWAKILRCKNFTANSFSKSRYLPHAFTEQGIYMLMTVLRGKGDKQYDYCWLLWSFEYNLKTKQYSDLLLKELSIEIDAGDYLRYVTFNMINESGNY